MTDPASIQTHPGAAQRRLPAEPGVWVFIGGDLLVFGFLFAVYLGYRVRDAGLYAASQRALDDNVGALNTVVLLTSSLFVVLALRAARNGDRRTAPKYVLAAAACGVLFAAIKVLEYHRELAAGHTPSSNHYFLFYFILTGLHLVHVVLGLGVLALLYRLTRRADELSPLGTSLMEGCACFWHLVDLLWIVLFPLLYLVR